MLMTDYFKKLKIAYAESKEWEKSHKGWEGVPMFCKECKEFHICKVPKNEMKEYEKHPEKNIQEIMPSVIPEEREMFISGFCPTCWNKIMNH